MAFPPPPPPESATRRVPYALASARQISQALLFVHTELEDNYPTMKWVNWANALLTVQPDLWVGPDTARLGKQGLKDVTRCLYAYLKLCDIEHLVFGPRGPYLAKQRVHDQYAAIDALVEIEANPLAYGPAVYRLVTSMARDNAVAHEVYQTAELYPHEHPASADQEAARSAVPRRLQALRNVRGEPMSNQHARDQRA